ncbi:MAG: patatin-like phospholipase family protein [Candidatus Marinimicrobia bacterium]|nr:patatin-like phospholipase family protein [Candidatus Neomarinimicrobiota bacterium]MBL7023728.1 patatin-like phospholipase family protein [Candidatus Neomarinimicrobiota bacterium]MBL7109509.1 patatin-like phospholipase family protein [Candidatus Neomarinimicrobiota bacterium]
MKKSKIKIGLALGSGGARGMVHIGVLKGLLDSGVPINLISGSSVGAVIGAMYSATLDINWVENKLKEFIYSDFYKSIGLDRLKPTPKREHPSILQTATRYVKEYISINVANERLGLLKSERLHKVIEYLLPVRKFEELRIPFSCIAADLHSGKDIVFNSGDLISALTASSSIPGYITPVEIDDMLLVDGGVSCPVPIQTLHKMGADFTIAVNAGVQNFRRLGTPHLMQILARVEQITSARLETYKFKDSDLVISPETKDLYWAEFEKIDELVKSGEKSISNLLPEIQSKLKKMSGLRGKLKKILDLVKEEK